MKKFLVEFTLRQELTINDLWPDGDAPKDPSPKDVVNLIDEYGGPLAAIDELNVFVTEIK